MSIKVKRSQFEPKDNKFVEKVRESVAVQIMTHFIGGAVPCDLYADLVN